MIKFFLNMLTQLNNNENQITFTDPDNCIEMSSAEKIDINESSKEKFLLNSIQHSANWQSNASTSLSHINEKYNDNIQQGVKVTNPFKLSPDPDMIKKESADSNNIQNLTQYNLSNNSLLIYKSNGSTLKKNLFSKMTSKSIRSTNKHSKESCLTFINKKRESKKIIT